MQLFSQKYACVFSILVLFTMAINVAQLSTNAKFGFTENNFQLEILEIEQENIEEEKTRNFIALETPEVASNVIFRNYKKEIILLFNPEIILPPPENLSI